MSKEDLENLENVYTQMLHENSQPHPKTGKLKANDGFEGAEKAQGKSIKSPEPTDAEGITQKKPVDGPSQDSDKSKPKPLGKKGAQAESVKLTFDQLYSKTINEEFGDEDEGIAPASDIESGDFNEDEGDFGEETDMDEEIDLASELRLLADRLSEIADKLSVEDETMGVGDMDMGGEEEDLGGEEEDPFLGKESIQHPRRKTVKEAITSAPNPTPLKKTSLGPKMKQNPKNNIGKSGAKKAKTPSAGKKRDGEPSVAPKTTLGPKMSQNPKGTGPATSAGNSGLFA